MVALRPILYEEKAILRNLMELFQYDLSAYTGTDINASGCYGYRYLDHYWTEAGREAFLILVEETIAGFVLIHEILELAPDHSGKRLAEFFMLRKFRRRGLGSEAARRVFDLYKGYWEVSFLSSNKPAKLFWEQVVGTYTDGRYQSVDIQEDWKGTVLILENRGGDDSSSGNREAG